MGWFLKASTLAVRGSAARVLDCLHRAVVAVLKGWSTLQPSRRWVIRWSTQHGAQPLVLFQYLVFTSQPLLPFLDKEIPPHGNYEVLGLGGWVRHSKFQKEVNQSRSPILSFKKHFNFLTVFLTSKVILILFKQHRNVSFGKWKHPLIPPPEMLLQVWYTYLPRYLLCMCFYFYKMVPPLQTVIQSALFTLCLPVLQIQFSGHKESGCFTK